MKRLIAVALLLFASVALADAPGPLPIPQLGRLVCMPDIVVQTFFDSFRAQAARIADLEHRLAAAGLPTN